MLTIGPVSGKDAITLPVSPPSYEVVAEMEHTSVNIVKLGEIILKGKEKLKTISFSSFFPNHEYNFINGSFQKPKGLVNKFEKWEKNATELQITIDKTVSMVVLISSLTYGENDGTGDINYTLQLTQYKREKGKRAQKEVKIKNYVCKAGDNFYKIARKCTGSTSNASKIAKYNKMKVNSKLKKGKKLVIKI